MNNLFAAKLLQNLNQKKGKKNKGFTLIELLVVVIIIGVLAAVALPNLLGQVAKGRQAEAKNNLGAVIRSQQAHRLEKGRFGVIEVGNIDNAATPPITQLPVAITDGNYVYTDQLTAPTATDAAQQATAATAFQDDIRDYSAGVGQTAAGGFTSVICEQDAVDGVTAPIAATLTAGVPTCTAGTTQL